MRTEDFEIYENSVSMKSIRLKNIWETFNTKHRFYNKRLEILFVLNSFTDSQVDLKICVIALFVLQDNYFSCCYTL